MARTIPYLLHRSGRYYARIVVPADARPALDGKYELREALGADRMAAVRALPSAVARLQAIIDAARAESKLNDEPRPGRPLSNRQMARSFYNAEMERDEAERAQSEVQPVDPSLFRAGYVEALRRVAAGRAPNDEIAAVIGWAVDGFIERGNARVAPGSAEWRQLARDLAGVQLETIKRSEERDRGEFGGKPTNPLLVETPDTATDPLTARIISPESTKTLTDLLPEFIKERGAKPSMNHEYAVAVRMLYEHIGEPVPVYRITRQTMQGFRRALTETPANYAKRFPGMTLPEAIKANVKRAAPYETLSAVTIADKWLPRLNTILKWCADIDAIPDNPATGITVTRVKSTEKPRVHFDPSDLVKLFGGPAFAPGEAFGEFQWSLLVSLYSGTRPSELAQLRLDSIRHVRNVLVLSIEEETKNVGSQRLIPVHKDLIRLGFNDRVASLRQAGETHMFPEWYRQGLEAKAKAERKAKATGEHVTLNQFFPRFIPRRFNVTYRAKVGITDKRKDFYAFRHTFKTGLSYAGVNRDIRDYLTGHHDTSAGSVYVHDISIERMHEAINQLRFDGFPL
ncbi:phage integrase family protein [Tepidamorphus gemmatus]|uniref:Phage integrase family protein n=1 Tax=Tepidamorphus gemmatus TaxID=747076 RepID=A0A4R3MHF0_9HYPH|nr:DUF6538 domain-containing protein [Tepidamorphus gemmatus]TCT12657.1 phage integrase family protein [Tepidamorphus gemmatus]